MVYFQTNLAEASMEGYGSKTAVLMILMMMMMMMIYKITINLVTFQYSIACTS
jgi:hypothetical protein